MNNLILIKKWIVNNSLELTTTVLAMFAPYIGLMWAIGVLVVIDTITGIWASNKRKEGFTKRKFWKVTEKLILFQIGIISGVIIQWVFSQFPFGDRIPAISGIASFIAIRETFSIFENIDEIIGTNILKYFKSLINRRKDAIDLGDIDGKKSTPNP